MLLTKIYLYRNDTFLLGTQSQIQIMGGKVCLRCKGKTLLPMFCLNTGKSFSEALILVSNNPQYDKRLFIDLPVQYMK